MHMYESAGQHAEHIGKYARTDPPQTDTTLADDALQYIASDLLGRGYRFTAVTPETHRRVNERLYDPALATLHDVFGWSRRFLKTSIPASIFDALLDARAVERRGEYWRSLVRFSTCSDDMFLHSAYPTSEVDAVFFGPDTYRFIRAFQTWSELPSGRDIRRVVDIGCGAGPGGIMAARRFPKSEVVLADINAAALRYSRINMAVARLENVAVRHSNLLNGLSGAYDLILSNPPYLVDPLTRSYRHGGGEFGAGLSLDIVDSAIQRLSPAGTLFLYTGVAIIDGGDPFRAAFESKLRAANFTWDYSEIDPDVFGEELEHAPYDRADRIAAVLLIARAPGEMHA